MTAAGIWILAEQRDGRVLRVSWELLTRGRELAEKRGCDLTAVLFGKDVPEDDLRGLIERGADRVIFTASERLEHFLVEPYAACLEELIHEHQPEILIAGATTTGRTLLPYVAIRVNAGLTADCTVLDIDPQTGNLLQTRPAIGGNILATIQTPNHRPQMATVRPRSTPPAEPNPKREGDILRREPNNPPPAGRVRRVDFQPLEDEHGLEDADAIVAIGRGLKKGENLPIAEDLAHTLDASLGATRDAVDRGWLSYPHQVGLSGKTVTPRLYVAAGVSGSIQHLAGMQTSETIVAINSDPEAQIFRVADFGIVGDLFEVLPVLTRQIQERKTS